ncbi:VOC family protein [Longimicrobium sp.]|jgi:catechol 2,3-dioxygenase-like lactoylglutathione lyase family enzyme|uniref:VOC family protein n=1 Tax=Longimicrobium sp. TaxID=2029185 RepID=UPI002F956021
MRAEEILEASVYASDLDAAERFYTSVLGLEVMQRVEGRHVFFRCGARVLLVFNPERTREGAVVPGHGSEGPGHVCFAMREQEIDAWRERLRAAGVPIETEHRWPSGGFSLYFRDPAGNSLELGTPRIWTIDEEDVFGVGKGG